MFRFFSVSLIVLSGCALASTSLEAGSSLTSTSVLKEQLTRASRLIWKSTRSTEDIVQLTILRLKLSRFPVRSPEIGINANPDKFSRTTPYLLFRWILAQVDTALTDIWSLDRISRAYMVRLGYHSLSGDRGDIDGAMEQLSKLTAFALSSETAELDARIVLARLETFRVSPDYLPRGIGEKAAVIKTLAEQAQYLILHNLETRTRQDPLMTPSAAANAVLARIDEEARFIFSYTLILTWSSELEEIFLNLEIPAETRRAALLRFESFHERGEVRRMAKTALSLDNLQEKLEFATRLLLGVRETITGDNIVTLEALAGSVIVWKTIILADGNEAFLPAIDAVLHEMWPVLDHQRNRLRLPTVTRDTLDAFLSSATSRETLEAYQRVYFRGQALMVSIASTEMVGRLHIISADDDEVEEGINSWLQSLSPPAELVKQAMLELDAASPEDIWSVVLTAEDRIVQIKKQSQLMVTVGLVREWIIDLKMIAADAACSEQVRAEATLMITTLRDPEIIGALRRSAHSLHNLAWKFTNAVDFLNREGQAYTEGVTALLGSLLAWRAHLTRLGDQVPLEARVTARALDDFFQSTANLVLYAQRRHHGLWVPKTSKALKVGDFEKLEALQGEKMSKGGSRAVFRALYNDDPVASLAHTASLACSFFMATGSMGEYGESLTLKFRQFSVDYSADEAGLFQVDKSL